METGVRSSWEASAVNCRSASKEASRRSNMPLKASARRENSSFPRGSAMRPDRSRASLMAAAVWVMLSRGEKLRLNNHPAPQCSQQEKEGQGNDGDAQQVLGNFLMGGSFHQAANPNAALPALRKPQVGDQIGGAARLNRAGQAVLKGSLAVKETGSCPGQKQTRFGCRPGWRHRFGRS